MTTTARAPLVRPRRAVIGGVCAGLAEHLGMPAGVVRAALAASTLVGGAGALLYLWLWALTPLQAAADRPGRVHRSFPAAPVLLGLGGLAALVSLVAAVSDDRADPVGPVLATLALTGGAVAWSLLLDRVDPERPDRYGRVVRILAAALLLVTAVLLLATDPRVLTAVLSVLMIVAGAGVLAAPAVVALWGELIEERSARAREESRAEVAAHLHDSVLQTLALIQNRAGASSEIARLARAQERELRDWLFGGTAPGDADLVAQLREAASDLELRYPVRFDLVATGDLAGRGFPAVLAAAREAMLNAARHAGGDVSVYVELSAHALDLYVRDRGPGFRPADVPADRLGVKESIIGRMQRNGGSAKVASGAAGTEVHLRLPIEEAP